MTSGYAGCLKYQLKLMQQIVFRVNNQELYYQWIYISVPHSQCETPYRNLCIGSLLDQNK